MYIVAYTQTFSNWLDELKVKNRLLSHRVSQRMRRMSMGNLGDVKSVGGLVSEARIFSTPALRLYFTIVDGTVVALLCGGDKNDQQKDIEKAQAIAAQLHAGEIELIGSAPIFTQENANET